MSWQGKYRARGMNLSWRAYVALPVFRAIAQACAMITFSRRHFLQISGLSLLAAGAARALEPFPRSGPPRLHLSLAAYSFRDYFKDQQGKVNPEGKLDMLSFLDYCAAHECAGAELTSYYFPSGRHGGLSAAGAAASFSRGRGNQRHLGGQ